MTRLQCIGSGQDSQAFSFRDRSRGYILRVNRERAGFDKDAFAFRNFASATLPIPEVLGTDTLHDNRFYCISRRLPGITLQDLPPDELAALLSPTAEILEEIARTDISSISGFGPFDGNGNGRYRSWHEFLVSIAPDLPCLAHLASYCPEIRCLVHGDFGSNNVLAQNGRITGVLDWSEAMIGDPLYDIANLFFWRGWLDCMEQQAQWFESRLDGLPHWRERLRCYQLRIGLEEQRQRQWRASPK